MCIFKYLPHQEDSRMSLPKCTCQDTDLTDWINFKILPKALMLCPQRKPNLPQICKATLLMWPRSALFQPVTFSPGLNDGHYHVQKRRFKEKKEKLQLLA